MPKAAIALLTPIEKVLAPAAAGIAFRAAAKSSTAVLNVGVKTAVIIAPIPPQVANNMSDTRPNNG